MKLFLNLTIVSSLVLALVGCNQNGEEVTTTNQTATQQVETQTNQQVETQTNQQVGTQTSQQVETQAKDGHGAEVSLSWAGLYEGKLLNPKTNQDTVVKLALNEDYTFVLTENYGKESVVSNGKFKFNGSLIDLGDDGNHQFFIGERYAKARKFYGKEVKSDADALLNQTQHFGEY